MTFTRNEKSIAHKMLNVMIIFALIGLLVGSFYDLAINKLLYANGTLFPTVFKIAGEMPMSTLIIAMAFALIQLSLKNKDKLVYFIFPTLIIIGFSLISARTIPGYFGIKNQLLSTGITLWYLISGYLLSLLAKGLDEDRLVRYAYFVIATILATLLIMSLMKSFWGRERFISMY